MNNEESDQLQEKESYDVKYISELRNYWNIYSYALINEIFTGIAINLGMSEKAAYNLAKNRPGTLQKAGFFKGLFDKFKTVFTYKVPKFRYKKKIYGDGSPMTPDQWSDFSNSIDEYWSNLMNRVSEDIAVKAHLMGKNTTEFREKKKPYKNKSLFQINEDQYAGDMPDNIKSAYENYDFSSTEKQSFNKSWSSIGMYIKQTGNEIEEAIRQQVQSGIDNNKSPVEVASDLYWNVQKNENFVNKYTAETLRKNWNRISSTEMATVYEAAVLAPYEADAMESMEDPSKARYFVRTGGSCPWCRARQGMIVRMVPADIVVDSKNESLKSMGIKDFNTDIAIWSGKNNIGLKQDEWMICCPAHPYNVATFQPIDLKDEWYNPKAEEIEKRQEKEKFVPQQKDYDYRSKEEEKASKPHYIDNNRIQFNENVYEAVSQEEYNRKLEEWKKDQTGPIPVNMNSPSYKRLFGEAEKYGSI